MMVRISNWHLLLAGIFLGSYGGTAQAQICPEPYTQECCDAVCNLDPFCCEAKGNWDEYCNELAKGQAACGDPPPQNDTCETAIEIFDGEAINGSNVNATLNGADIPASCSYDPSFQYDLWYKIEITDSALLTLSTCNSADFDTRLFLFTSCILTDLIACNDDVGGCATYTSTLASAVDPGMYYIMVDGYAGAQGSFQMSVMVETGSAPGNDDLANAIEVFEGSTAFTSAFSTTDGTTLPGGECAAATNFEFDVWFTYTATSSTRMAFTTSDLDTTFDSQMELLDSMGMSLACNDDGFGAAWTRSTIWYDVTLGETYTIRIGGFGNSFGDGVLHIASPPSNDDCADAIALTVDEAAMFNSFAANDSPEQGIPDDTVCDSFGLAEFFGDVWYTFEVPEDAFYRVELCDLTDGLDSRIGIYDSCGGILLACNEDSCGLESSVYLAELTAGTMLTIRVGGFTNGNDRAYGQGGVLVTKDIDDPCDNPRSIFDFGGDLAATEGDATIAAVGGDESWFELTTDLIDGTETGVLHVLGQHSNTQSLGINTTFCPNPSTAAFVNDFTMIWDVKVTPNWIPLFNANRGDPANYNDAEFFITPAGQFYINGAGYLGAEGTVQPDTWYRIALVEDLASGNAYVYINGELSVTGAGAVTFDGAHSLYVDLCMVFADDSNESGEAWLSSYLIDDYPMSAKEIMEFGGPTAGGISESGGGTDCPADLNGDGQVGGADLTILLGNWGFPGDGDLDGSGSVGGADLTIMLGTWGSC